jgi:hypothetical protein
LQVPLMPALNAAMCRNQVIPGMSAKPQAIVPAVDIQTIHKNRLPHGCRSEIEVAMPPISNPPTLERTSMASAGSG